MAKQLFDKTGILTRFILRKDRIRFPDLVHLLMRAYICSS